MSLSLRREDGPEPEVVYVLLEDGDLTSHSSPEPIGIALRSEDDARAWVAEGQWRAVVAVRVFADREAAEVARPELHVRTRAEIQAELDGLWADREKRARLDAGEVVEAPIPPDQKWLTERIRAVEADLLRNSAGEHVCGPRNPGGAEGGEP